MAELTREVLVKAEPSTIFKFLIEPGLQSWLGTDVELDARPGGIYKINYVGDHHALGEFTEVVENEKVVFTFGWNEPGHPIPAGSTKVAITLIPNGDETIVRLVHSGLPEDAITDHQNGWQFFLDRLAVVASGGELVDSGERPPDPPRGA
jgi:uncharacterized protein YndB with AHSA1/START domain